MTASADQMTGINVMLADKRSRSNTAAGQVTDAGAKRTDRFCMSGYLKALPYDKGRVAIQKGHGPPVLPQPGLPWTPCASQ